MSTKTFRSYQDRGYLYLVRSLTSTDKLGLLVGPCGCGKTSMGKAALKVALEDGLIRGAIVVTPQLQVAYQFGHPDSYMVANPDGTPRKVDLALSDFVLLGSKSRAGRSVGSQDSREKFLDFLSNPRGRILVTTHSMLLTLDRAGTLPSQIPKDIALATDEGHHSGEVTTKMYGVLKRLWNHGRACPLLYLTASPDRTDRRPMLPIDIEPETIPYSELLSTGLFPKICFQVLEMNPGLLRTPGKLQGMDAEQVASLIHTLGEPTILKAPVGANVGDALWNANCVNDALVALGHNKDMTFNTIGDGLAADVAMRMLKEREILATVGWSGATFTFVLSCGRMNEGADWPAATRGVCIGMPTSPMAVLQFLGRLLRSKVDIKDLNPNWADQATLTVVIPKLDHMDILERRKMASFAINIACLLECSEAAVGYSSLWEDMVKGMRIPPAVRNPFKTGTFTQKGQKSKRTVYDLVTWLKNRVDSNLTLGRVFLEIQNRVPKKEQIAVLKEFLIAQAPAHPTIHTFIQQVMVKYGKSCARSSSKTPVAFDELLRKELQAMAIQLEPLIVTHANVANMDGLQVFFDDPAALKALESSACHRWSNVMDQGDDLSVSREILTPFHAAHGEYPQIGQGIQTLTPFSPLSVRELTRERRFRSGIRLDVLCMATACRILEGPDLDRNAIRKVGRRAGLVDDRNLDSAKDIAAHRLSPRMWMQVGGRRENLVDIALCLKHGWRGCPGGETLKSVVVGPSTPVIP